MSIPTTQRPVAAFLTQLAGGPPRETHVSAVFVGTDAVWKLKKAVRFDFLDFSSPAQREAMLRRELTLNRRTAPELYRDVVPVRRDATSLALGDGAGEVVDWVLRMAPIPADDFFDAIAARGALTPELLDALADAIAAFHAALPPAVAPAWDRAMEDVAEGNARSARDAGLDAAQVAAWRAEVRREIDTRRAWLTRRAAAGFVRHAHGDLHLGNLCLWRGRPVLFDALEFDDALATIDLGYDLAFLLMDLDCRAGRAAANHVLNRYVARRGDAAMIPGLPLYLSQRAMVRAHVQASRGEADSADYLAAAQAYLRPAPGLVGGGGRSAGNRQEHARARARADAGRRPRRPGAAQRRDAKAPLWPRAGGTAWGRGVRRRGERAHRCGAARHAARYGHGGAGGDRRCDLHRSRISRGVGSGGEGGRAAVPRPLAAGAAGRA